MTMFKRHFIKIASFAAGMLVGYIMLHPFTMVTYALLHIHPEGQTHVHWSELGLKAITSFEPAMAPMAIAFSFFGGTIGLLIGILFEKRKRLIVAEHENEKRTLAVATLQKLMVTLSHYLLNANMIIGGKVRRCKRSVSNQDTLEDLKVVEDQAKKIDAVITSLRNLTEIKTVNYSSDGRTTMIDIAEQIEAELTQQEKRT